MSIPNPQHVEIYRILSGVPLFHYHLHEKTRYFFNYGEVMCLGTYGYTKNNDVAIFGEWEGPEEGRPYVLVSVINRCTHAFLLRSATDQEIAEYGGRKALVHLEVAQMLYMCGTSYAETVIFRPKSNTGFYNPVV